MLTAILLAILATGSYSCKKDLTNETFHDENPASSLRRPADPGFAANDMVMYWNEKAAQILNPGYSQPARTRVFARIQVAVHDALNSIKPKYERYALQEGAACRPRCCSGKRCLLDDEADCFCRKSSA